jgi:hypothetical protein
MMSGDDSNGHENEHERRDEADKALFYGTGDLGNDVCGAGNGMRAGAVLLSI